jgi:hypothetical protein
LPDLLERLVALEADVLYREPAGEEEPRIGSLPGTTPVLLSAPHGAIHTRRGELKEEEEFTAALACLVAGLTDAHALYARRKSPTDPNWYRDVPYKRRLRRIVAGDGIAFVLDIHGTAPSRELGVALGTMHGRSCPEHRGLIIRRLEERGFRQRGDGVDYVDHIDCLDTLDVDETFTAAGLDGQETVTAFAWETLGVPSAQLELRPGLRVVERRADATLPRPFHADPRRIKRIVQVLVDVVEAIASRETSHG